MPQFAFFKKQFVPLSEAKVGIMTHALNYGTACFEGIRGNWNGDRGQMYLFRLEDHYRRMLKSCHILKIKLPYTADQLSQITVELVAKNGIAGNWLWWNMAIGAMLLIVAVISGCPSIAPRRRPPGRRPGSG